MPSAQIDIDRLILYEQEYTDEFAETVLRNYYSYIFGISQSILNCYDDAADATQRTFIDALAKIDRYQPGTNFKAWLSRIAVNKCRGMLRKRMVRQKLFNALSFIYSRSSDLPSALDTVEKNETNNRLWLSVIKLSPKHRLVVVLRYFHNLSISEIAEIARVPEGTVHSRLHYALRNLRRDLEA